MAQQKQNEPDLPLDVRKLACSRLFDEVPCMVSIQDRELRIVDANRKFLEEFGPRIGEFCYQVYKGRSESCPECPVVQTFEDEKEHRSEQTVFDKRGLPHDMIVNTKTLRDREGRVVAVMEVFTEITAIKDLQRKLYDSVIRFNTLFDQVPCFISVQDRDFRIVEANHLFIETFAGRPGDFCYRAYKKREEPCDPCPVARTFEDGEVHCSEEIVVDSEGREINVLVYTSPLRDAQGHISSVMEVGTDITELRRLQDRLANLGQIMAGIAHSVKNVLEGLRGGVYITNVGFQNNDQESIKTGWEMVQRNVDRISSMIMDMLYCAKERKPEREPVSLGEVVKQVVEELKPRAESCGVELVADLPPDLPELQAGPKEIYSLVSNLIMNAIDACCSDENEEKQHRVEVSLSLDRKHLLLAVKDNGVGIDPDTKRKLFKLFFSTKGTFGTGLGLLVAHKVATEHGGNIHVESEPGQGSVFTVKLPLSSP